MLISTFMSPGGTVTSGMAMYDTMQYTPNPDKNCNIVMGQAPRMGSANAGAPVNVLC